MLHKINLYEIQTETKQQIKILHVKVDALGKEYAKLSDSLSNVEKLEQKNLEKVNMNIKFLEGFGRAYIEKLIKEHKGLKYPDKNKISIKDDGEQISVTDESPFKEYFNHMEIIESGDGGQHGILDSIVPLSDNVKKLADPTVLNDRAIIKQAFEAVQKYYQVKIAQTSMKVKFLARKMEEAYPSNEQISNNSDSKPQNKQETPFVLNDYLGIYKYYHIVNLVWNEATKVKVTMEAILGAEMQIFDKKIKLIDETKVSVTDNAKFKDAIVTRFEEQQDQLFNFVTNTKNQIECTKKLLGNSLSGKKDYNEMTIKNLRDSIVTDMRKMEQYEILIKEVKNENIVGSFEKDNRLFSRNNLITLIN